ncbi:MAG: PIN domain nuclease [Pseudonocardia sp.]
MALVDYLADTSVLTRLAAPVIKDRVSGLVRSGAIALCAVSVAEVLRGTRSPEHHRETRIQLGAFFWLPIPDETWDRLLDVQSALAERGLQQRVKIPDLLIAAVAERRRVPVLHYDQDFDAIAEITGQACEWVVPRGSVT